MLKFGTPSHGGSWVWLGALALGRTWPVKCYAVIQAVAPGLSASQQGAPTGSGKLMAIISAFGDIAQLVRAQHS